MKARKRRPAENPTELVVMGANPITEGEIVVPAGTSISITITIGPPEESRRNSLLHGFACSPGVFGRKCSTEEILELNRLTEPSHAMELIRKAGGDTKKSAQMSREEIDDVQSGRWARKRKTGGDQ
jgi:hypothetical protein